MAWSNTDLVLITYSAVNYYFAPHELVYVGNPLLQVNQLVQESESGERTIQEIDTNARAVYQFAIDRMPESDRSVGGTTIRGYSTLETLITSTLNYRENACTLKPSGTLGTSTARYNQSDFPAIKWVLKTAGGDNYYGDGSQIITFRTDI